MQLILRERPGRTSADRDSYGWNRFGDRPRRISVILYLRRVVVLLLLVLAPLPVAARPAWACSCATDFDPLERSELAFVGVAEDIDGSWTSREVKVEFAVDSVVQGSAGESVTLVTSEDSASCGYEFVEGSRYRVYANDGETSLCDGNELLAAGDGADRTRTVWVGSILAFVLIVIAGAVTWLARHSRQTPKAAFVGPPQQASTHLPAAKGALTTLATSGLYRVHLAQAARMIPCRLAQACSWMDSTVVGRALSSLRRPGVAP